MKYFILISIFIFMLLSCRKDESNTIHRDVFKCEINGVPWEAKCVEGPLFGCNEIDCQYYENSSSLEIVASNTVDDTSSFHIYVNSNNGGLQIGENILEYTRLSFNNIRYNIDPCCNSTLELLALQKDKKVIECNFSVKLVSEAGDTVLVSRGYFKSKYRP